MHSDVSPATETIQAGASGYLLKQSADRPVVKLTPRERQVLRLIAEGMSAKEIAAALDISTRTAEFHKYNLQDKLGLKTTDHGT